MIGRRGERGSGISVLAARHDDDDDNKKYNCIFILFTIAYTYFWLKSFKTLDFSHK